MDHLSELRKLVFDATEALRASVEILADDSLPQAARVTANSRCIDLHRKLVGEIERVSQLYVAQSQGPA